MINTAFTYRDLTQDGNFSTKDIGKVMYGLGYSFNLLMAVFVEAPWAVIRDATPVLIDGKNVGILDRSAGYWRAKGNAAWSGAIRGFKVSMVAMGGFGLAAVTLELFDVTNDFYAAKTSEEKKRNYCKGHFYIRNGSRLNFSIDGRVVPCKHLHNCCDESMVQCCAARNRIDISFYYDGFELFQARQCGLVATQVLLVENPRLSLPRDCQRRE
ncbi:putative Membrane protein [Pseudomonas syringae pv. syringae]|nr:putative Membrane protein [Pseudomonas syringae pv. syringae]